MTRTRELLNGKRSVIEWLESTERLFGLRSSALDRLCSCLPAVTPTERAAGGDLLRLGSSFTLKCPTDGAADGLGALLGFGAGALGAGTSASPTAIAGEADRDLGSCEGEGV